METPFKKANDEFFESKQGQRLCLANTLNLKPLEANDIYLKNRLERAFVAGWIACMLAKKIPEKDGV